MSTSWTENEIRIALARENEDDAFFRYVKSCYESALKAVKSEVLHGC